MPKRVAEEKERVTAAGFEQLAVGQDVAENTDLRVLRFSRDESFEGSETSGECQLLGVAQELISKDEHAVGMPGVLDPFEGLIGEIS